MRDEWCASRLIFSFCMCAATTAATTTSMAPTTTTAPTTATCVSSAGALTGSLLMRSSKQQRQWCAPPDFVCSGAVATSPSGVVVEGFQQCGGYCKFITTLTIEACAAMCTSTTLSGVPETQGNTLLCPPIYGVPCNTYAYSAPSRSCLTGNLGTQPCNFNNNPAYQGGCISR